MSAVKPLATIVVYQLKVSLHAITPMIWRRLRVTSAATIAEFHQVLQIVMGWEDLHLHQFRIQGKAYGIARLGGITFADDPHQVTLADFKLRQGERFRYDYDFGDGWRHDLQVEQVLPYDANTTYPVCSGGAGDCPPKDCGGPGGYQQLLQERSSWTELEQVYEDAGLVAERLLAWQQGGPRPSADDAELGAALERMRARQEQAPRAFDRGAVNAALRQREQPPEKEPPCASGSK